MCRVGSLLTASVVLTTLPYPFTTEHTTPYSPIIRVDDVPKQIGLHSLKQPFTLATGTIRLSTSITVTTAVSLPLPVQHSRPVHRVPIVSPSLLGASHTQLMEHPALPCLERKLEYLERKSNGNIANTTHNSPTCSTPQNEIPILKSLAWGLGHELGPRLGLQLSIPA